MRDNKVRVMIRYNGRTRRSQAFPVDSQARRQALILMTDQGRFANVTAIWLKREVGKWVCSRNGQCRWFIPATRKS